jgi:hypothetical protein
VSASTVLTDDEIIIRCQSGELVHDLAPFSHDDADPASLLNRCIDLHNSGQIDLLQLIGAPQFAALTGYRFFGLQQFFCKAIPKLNALSSSLMDFVRILVERGGTDLMAAAPNEAFRNWCAADLSRARAVVDAARQGDALAGTFAAFALHALEDVALARSFIVDYSDERRVAALFILGRIKPTNEQEADDTIAILLPFVVTGYDGTARCNALMSVFRICEQFPGLAPATLPKLVGAASTTPSSAILFCLAQALLLHGKLFDRTSIGSVLEALKAADPQSSGVVHELDMALARLLSGPDADLAVGFISELLAPEDSRFDLDQFESFKHELTTGARDRLFALLVRWLLSGSLSLGNSALKILTAGEPLGPFETTVAGMGLTPDDCVFLAYKALGWLFAKGTIAASILIAVLRGCDLKITNHVGELLFDPLLVNYSGEVREYLKTIGKGDPAYKAVRKALAKGDAYIRALKIKEPIKELWPSEYQRKVERMQAHDMMRKVQKAAEKQSVLFSLVHRSTLLYGRKALTFVTGPDKKRRAINMDLHSFSTSFERPRGEIIDPVGLNITLLTFRSMQRK